MTRLPLLLILLALIAGPSVAQEAETTKSAGQDAEDPRAAPLRKVTQGFLDRVQKDAPGKTCSCCKDKGLKVTKDWPADDRCIGLVLGDSGAAARARAKEILTWGRGFGARQRHPARALILHVLECRTEAEAKELVGLLRKDVIKNKEALEARTGKSFPALADWKPRTEGEAGNLEGFELETRPDLGETLGGPRITRLAASSGRHVIYVFAMDGLSTFHLRKLALRLNAELNPMKPAAPSADR